MSIEVPRVRAPIDACSRSLVDTGLSPLNDVCAVGVTQGGDAEEVPIDEGTHLVGAVERSYEEIAASLSSNKGTLSLLFRACFCLHLHTLYYTCDH